MSNSANPAMVQPGQFAMPPQTVPMRGQDIPVQGGQIVTDAALPTINPLMAQPGQAVGTTAANTYNSAVNATNNAMNFQPGSIAGADLTQYQNPYQQQVIDNNLASMNRANQMALNNVGAQADNAGAFGGSRQGVAEAQTNAEFQRQANQMIAQQNMAGFQNAQNMAQYDIGNQFNQQNAVLNAANQLGGLSQQGFNYDQTLNNNLANVGNQQQNLIQQLINAANQQYGGITGYGANMLQLPLAAVGAAPMTSSTSGTTTGSTTGSSTYNPGIFDYLTAGANAMGGMGRGR